MIFALLPLPLSVALALIFDLTLGDPPNRYHPVAWMGSGIAWARRRAPRQGRVGPLFYGAAIVCGGASVVAMGGWVVTYLTHFLPAPCSWLVHAWVLKSTLALKGLTQAGKQIHAALSNDNVTEARRLLSWHLVSRDTSQLSAAQVAAATVESLAENTSDGVIAPLFYYCLGGLPAALAYRFMNTADAMLGYRDAEREWLGKIPARLDDLANLIPARLTALCLMLAAGVLRENAWQCGRVWWRDAGLTASPNAGHPMSAMAGALHIVLEKVGHYCLGAELPLPGDYHIPRAIRLVYGTVAVGITMLLALSLGQWYAR
jgi:adenosylcobinamide-phosphate synthase